MDWFALETRRDDKVAEDLAAASISVVRPTYRFSYWDNRRSVTMTRDVSLLPGYLLVGESCIPTNTTRHWFSFMKSASGLPLRVPDAALLIARCERGEFDVIPHKKSFYEAGAMVLVSSLGLIGEVVRRMGHQYRVEFAELERVVTVDHRGVVDA